MEITEVRITLRNEDKLKAFASVTFDRCFVIRGLKVINGTQGYFVSMPSRKRKDGTYQDLAHPISNEMRKYIEDSVLAVFDAEQAKVGFQPVHAGSTGGDEYDLEDENGRTV